MLELLIDAINVKTLTMLLAAVAAGATVLTLAMPLVAGDTLDKRMKAVAVEREKIRQRERERMARGEKVNLRPSAKQYMQTVVDQFNLSKWVGQEAARSKLIQAGYRGHAPYVTYLFFRLVAPIAMFIATSIYVFALTEFDQPFFVKIGICVAGAYLGMHLPLVILKNRISKRQLSIRRAFPDALDLLLICV